MENCVEYWKQCFVSVCTLYRTLPSFLVGDLSTVLDNIIDSHYPKAKRHIDPFHVVQYATDALDEVLCNAWREVLKKVKSRLKKARSSQEGILKKYVA